MRFFDGTRNSNAGSKKGLASAMYKQKMLGKPSAAPETPEEKYRKMLDKKMDAIMNDVAMGRKKGFELPGTVPKEQKEMSKNFKALLQQMAAKKLQKEANAQKKKERAQYFKDRSQKKAEESVKRAEEAKKLAAQKQTTGGSYFFGTVQDDKKWWW